MASCKEYSACFCSVCLLISQEPLVWHLVGNSVLRISKFSFEEHLCIHVSLFFSVFKVIHFKLSQKIFGFVSLLLCKDNLQRRNKSENVQTDFG